MSGNSVRHVPEKFKDPGIASQNPESAGFSLAKISFIVISDLSLVPSG